MSRLTKEEYFKNLATLLGEKSDPDSVKMLEDMTDTYNALEAGEAGDGIDWKKKCEEVDKAWQKRYSSRFFNGDSGSGPQRETGSESGRRNPEDISYGDLFVRS